MTEVYTLFSTSVAEANLLGVYATPEAAMAAKPGQWTWVEPKTARGETYPGYWEGVTENEPGWHLGRGHFIVERHGVQS